MTTARKKPQKGFRFDHLGFIVTEGGQVEVYGASLDDCFQHAKKLTIEVTRGRGDHYVTIAEGELRNLVPFLSEAAMRSPRCMSYVGVAEAIRVSRDTVRRWADAGLPVNPTGSGIDLADVVKWLRDRARKEGFEQGKASVPDYAESLSKGLIAALQQERDALKAELASERAAREAAEAKLVAEETARTAKRVADLATAKQLEDAAWLMTEAVDVVHDRIDLEIEGAGEDAWQDDEYAAATVGDLTTLAHRMRNSIKELTQ